MRRKVQQFYCVTCDKDYASNAGLSAHLRSAMHKMKEDEKRVAQDRQRLQQEARLREELETNNGALGLTEVPQEPPKVNGQAKRALPTAEDLVSAYQEAMDTLDARYRELQAEMDGIRRVREQLRARAMEPLPLLHVTDLETEEGVPALG